MTHMNRPHMKKSLFPPGMYCVMSLESFTPTLCALNLIEGFFFGNSHKTDCTSRQPNPIN